MKIIEIDPESPLFGTVRPGYTVVAVNGSPVEDEIDFRFKTAEEQVSIRFADQHGTEFEHSFDEQIFGDLGLTFDDGHVRTCNNNCIFCFVHQQPKGMRRPLYTKDEDYRLSFTHGNFVTLTNTSDTDMKRIIEQRLSPLYVSVHTTNDELRRKMLGKKELPSIMQRLRHLTENGIRVHTQIVLCPEVNDGDELTRSINDLSGLYPEVESLAVVPVGLTRFRKKLPSLRTYTNEEAVAIVAHVEEKQKQLYAQLGSRFVWAADEFYVRARRPFPTYKDYEEMPQFENGVGMVREFITLFNRRRSALKGFAGKGRVKMLTGHSAYPFLNDQIMPFIRERTALRWTVTPVDNRFWGSTVTVSGLLTGQDMLRSARSASPEFDTLVLPPNCLNNDDLFLDNLTLDQFRNALGKEVVVGSYNLVDTMREVS